MRARCAGVLERAATGGIIRQVASDRAAEERTERLSRDVAANEAARREILLQDGRRSLGENIEQADSIIKAAFEMKRAFAASRR